MGIFEIFWFDILYQPLYNALLFFYTISPGKDMGLAIIFLTITIRLLLLPLSIRGARSEFRLQRLQPAIDVIKKRYRHDIQKQKHAIKELLHENHIGVMSNLISLGFQIIFFVVLYKIFSSGLQLGGRNALYSFNLKPGVIDSYFFEDWFILIAPYVPASLFASGVVFLQQALRRVRDYAHASTLDKALLFGLPIGTYLGTMVLPSSKAVFIATTVCFSLWLRLVKWLIVKLFVKDEEVKENMNQLWTN